MKSLTYDVNEFKRQLNSKDISLENYKIEDTVNFLQLAKKYNLDLVKINPKIVKKPDNSIFYLRGTCETDAAKEANDIIVSKLRTIKLNLSLNDYKFNCSENQPDSLDSMLEYIDKNIILIQYPVAENDSEFHSFYLWHEDIPKPVIFINTNEYVDNQYFYLAHELYHHFYKDGDEKKADKYAAQLLIPDWMLMHFDSSNPLLSIIEIQKTSRMSYKAIVKALYNRNKISKDLYDELMEINPREKSGKYFELIADEYDRLNYKKNVNSVSNFMVDIILDNFKKNKISKTYLFESYYELFGEK